MASRWWAESGQGFILAADLLNLLLMGPSDSGRDFILQFWEGAFGPFRLEKLVWKTLNYENCYIAQTMAFSVI